MSPRTNIHSCLFLQDSCTPPGICLRRCPPSLLSLQRRYTRLSTRYRFLRRFKVKKSAIFNKPKIQKSYWIDYWVQLAYWKRIQSPLQSHGQTYNKEKLLRFWIEMPAILSLNWNNWTPFWHWFEIVGWFMSSMSWNFFPLHNFVNTVRRTTFGNLEFEFKHFERHFEFKLNI